MSLKAKLEAIIYAAETPITLEHIFQLVKESVISDGAPDEAEAKSVVRATLEDLVADFSTTDHGVEIRQVAGGYRMSTKPEHHDVVRIFAKSLKPPIRLSLPGRSSGPITSSAMMAARSTAFFSSRTLPGQE